MSYQQYGQQADDKIAELRAKVVAKNEQIARLQAKVAAKNALIQQLQEQLDA